MQVGRIVAIVLDVPPVSSGTVLGEGQHRDNRQKRKIISRRKITSSAFGVFHQRRPVVRPVTKCRRRRGEAVGGEGYRGFFFGDGVFLTFIIAFPRVRRRPHGTPAVMPRPGFSCADPPAVYGPADVPGTRTRARRRYPSAPRKNLFTRLPPVFGESPRIRINGDQSSSIKTGAARRRRRRRTHTYDPPA